MIIAFGLAGLALTGWGCIAIIAAHYGIGLYPPYGWAEFILRYAAPWITLVGGFMLWKQARTWRRLYSLRGKPIHLTRNPIRQGVHALPQSPLERAGKFLTGLAGAALIYWFNLPGPEFLLIAGLLVWFFKSAAFAILRRPDHG